MRLASALTRSLQKRVKRCPGRVLMDSALMEKGLNKLPLLSCFRFRHPTAVCSTVSRLY